ncbi:uroporphyrinogen-III synthase [Oceanicaulis alexandrii]|uniref:uroporphyrinogen-III synthase n=1 Tax=Oceanicaulis alexandrii TaxID=153233 RepID=UPI002355A736|nr:uroporphyrinogen-III synthase [Oceanicaulis alexandrii]
MSKPCVLVTRAEPGAARTCAALSERGFETINAATAHLTAHPVTLNLEGIGLIAVTSPFGATCLANATSDRTTPVIAVGDVTAARLSDAGFEHVTSASGDARDLLEIIRKHPPQGEVLHVRGVDQTGDLSTDLNAHGQSARSEILYAAEPVAALPDTAWNALETGACVLIHSAKGAERFWALAQTAGQTETLRAAPVIAISEAAAEPLRRHGISRLSLAARPDESALFDALEKQCGETR